MIYVVHRSYVFIVFGTTPEMRTMLPIRVLVHTEWLGYKRRRVSEVETVSDVAFNSNPAQQTETRLLPTG